MMINNIAKLLQNMFSKKANDTQELPSKKPDQPGEPNAIQKELDRIEAQMHLPKSTNTPTTNSLNVHIGDLAAKYETSGRGVGFISTGMGGKDPGGISYGNYQLETKKGTMQAYLKSKESGVYGVELSKLKINSQAFKEKWKYYAEILPEDFNYSQFLYLANKPNGYNDAIKHAEKLGWNTDNFAMQSAIYSTVNQSGGWKTGIFNKAGIKKTDDIKTQLNKLYNARANYFVRININMDVKKSIIKNRTGLIYDPRTGKLRAYNGINERKDALKLV